MRVSIALVSVVFALAGSAVTAPLSVDGTLKARSKLNSDEPNSLENTVTNPSSNIADFFISLDTNSMVANLMSGTQAGGNASVNVGGSADSGNSDNDNNGNVIGGSDCINKNAIGGNGGNGGIAVNGGIGGTGGSGGTILSRNSGSGSNFVDEIEDDPDETNNNTKRGNGTSTIAQAGSNDQICGASGA